MNIYKSLSLLILIFMLFSCKDDIIDKGNSDKNIINITFENQIGNPIFSDNSNVIKIMFNQFTEGKSKIKLKNLELAAGVFANISVGDEISIGDESNSTSLEVTSESGIKQTWIVNFVPFSEELVGTWRITTLSVYGGAWPEYNSSAAYSSMTDRSWNWKTDGTGPVAEYDNTLTFTLEGISESGDPYGKVINSAGADGKFADFIFMDNPNEAASPIDVNYHYRKIPRGESSWKRNIANGTITFTAADQSTTIGFFVGPGTEILDQNSSITISDRAFTFDLQPTYIWLDIYKDRERFVENAKKYWIQVTKTTGSVDLEDDIVVTTARSKASPFVGIGPQWGGYDNVEKWTGSPSLSNDDWNKLFQRVQFLRPGLVRIMTSQGWNYMVDGVYNPQKSAGILFKILDFCEAQGISVMYGEWGEAALPGQQVDTAWLNRATDFLGYLINTKGYTCLKYYNMCNEPAGSWSSIGNDYGLWQRTYQTMFSFLEAKGLSSKIDIIAPDVAVWNDTSLSYWLTWAMDHFGSKIDAYDIHTYPTDEQVKGGSYKNVIAAYRNLVPENQHMIMGELGYKYDPNTYLGQQNLQRIANDPHASDDSNMMIYDAFYGADMADAVIQNMDAGYNGIILWNMDDAMYDNGDNKLKRWGFWNILGDERFGGLADEAIRPWFYPMSLLCRYFPQGSTIYKTQVPDKQGLHAIGGMKNGKYTIAIANSHTETYSVNLKMDAGIILTNAKWYKYEAGSGSQFTGPTDNNGFAVAYNQQTTDFSNNRSVQLTIPAKSFLLITDFEY
ncbi:hypothetical protein [uncultured Dysgonomonas sp.]|uniref:Uncharacterized protein n=1 Tax=uncultured Dysgonomonas sp. TaxID=206096 RepID=A0A212K5E4_9BACT|nr:hypothetical protein [uncultured Dysgonomonas sp.]SBW06876.1 conserved exported hypothetical protein [uncultured Dysgonomonas sp.]